MNSRYPNLALTMLVILGSTYSCGVALLLSITTVCSTVALSRCTDLSSVFGADLNAIFKASLSCGHFLLSPNLPEDKTSVMRMLQNGHTLMSIATLMYAPLPLKEVGYSYMAKMTLFPSH